MGLVDELLKLEQLRQRGTLSDEEFERAKLKLLEAEQPPQTTDGVACSLEEADYKAELARIDREWDMEVRKYTAIDPFSLLCLFGAFAIALVFQNSAILFPLFTIIFLIIAVVLAFRGIANGRQYRDAQARYVHRRNSLRRSGEK